jgi:hypothetical protein
MLHHGNKGIFAQSKTRRHLGPKRIVNGSANHEMAPAPNGERQHQPMSRPEK